jgi:sulfite reductase alpha subunit-like flavoprotein
MYFLQDVAERIAREAKRRHFAPRVMAADAYPVTDLPAERLAVFVASTTGQARTTLACELVPSLLPAESFSHTLATESVLISGAFPVALASRGSCRTT